MSDYPTSWDDIPEREPLPPRGGRGPGLNGEDLTKIKIKEHLGEDIAVMGFLILPNGFKSKPDDPDEYCMVEVMDAEGATYMFTTTSNSLIQQLELRDSRGEIPFRTAVIEQPTRNNPTIKYYTFR